MGYRDQLQDVLPLILIEPALARAQIVLHAGQQSPRATCSNGGIAGRAAAPASPNARAPAIRICGCLLLARYVRQSGDASVLGETTHYLEARAVPQGDDTALVMPRPSRDFGDVYDIVSARSATRWRGSAPTACRCSRPATGTTASTHSGRKGIGTSVWMGFLFFDVLDGFCSAGAIATGRSLRRDLRTGA